MPKLSLDAGDRWVARNVCVVAAGASAGILASLANLVLTGSPVAAAPTAVLVAELAIVVLVLWLNRRGLPHAAARLLAISLPLLAGSLMITSGNGFRDVSMLIMPASMILCGLLLEPVTLVTVTLLSIACTAAAMLAEARGWLARWPSTRRRTSSTRRSSWG